MFLLLELFRQSQYDDLVFNKKRYTSAEIYIFFVLIYIHIVSYFLALSIYINHEIIVLREVTREIKRVS